MKYYHEPEIEIVGFGVEDILTTSTETLPDLDGQLVGDCI